MSTEYDIYAALERMFRAPAYIMLAGVRNQTGYSRITRTADALAVSVFPSRGLYAIGFEIKTARGDWKRELDNPAKSEEIMRFCRHWYVAAPAGVVNREEVPQTWGYIEAGEKRSRVVVRAPVLSPEPPSMAFVCSVLRSASAACVPAHSVQPKIEAAHTEAMKIVDSLVDRRTKELREKIERFEEASGVTLGERWECGRIGKAVKLVRAAGAENMTENIAHLVNACENLAKHGREVLADQEKAGLFGDQP